MSVKYSPMPPQPDSGKDATYTYDELQDLAKALEEAQPFMLLQVLNVEPDKPREGMVVAADGSNWDPGAGGGFYGYFGGGWHALS